MLLILCSEDPRHTNFISLVKGYATHGNIWKDGVEFAPGGEYRLMETDRCTHKGCVGVPVAFDVTEVRAGRWRLGEIIESEKIRRPYCVDFLVSSPEGPVTVKSCDEDNYDMIRRQIQMKHPSLYLWWNQNTMGYTLGSAHKPFR